MEKFNNEFKINAVNLVVSQSLSVARVAKDLGIGKSTLHRWVCQHRDKTLVKSDKTPNLVSQLALLKRKNRILEQERDILKKAMGILSQQTKQNTY